MKYRIIDNGYGLFYVEDVKNEKAIAFRTLADCYAWIQLTKMDIEINLSEKI